MRDKDAAELLQRARRIETRLTQFMIASGVDTEHTRPVLTKEPGELARVAVPSRHTPLSEIMQAIGDHNGVVLLYIEQDFIGQLDRHAR
jgi:hypothetical protein